MATPQPITSTYAAGQVDTTGVTGFLPGSVSNTQDRFSTKDTSGANGGYRAVDPAVPGAVTVDTSGTIAKATTYVPAHPEYATQLDTLTGAGNAVGTANPAYRAPSGPVPAGQIDTTWTDRQPGGSTTYPAPYGLTVTNLDTSNIGAPGYGGPSTGSIPATPAKPTAASAPRGATVTFAHVADPSGDKVLGYVIENSAGGTTFAGRDKTSVFDDNLVPGTPYRFRVAARNKAGTSAFSPWSDPASASNPDAANMPVLG